MQNKNVICLLGRKQYDGRSNMVISLLPVCNNHLKCYFKTTKCYCCEAGQHFSHTINGVN